MPHIILLVYLLSGISGVSSLIFLFGKYGAKNSQMRNGLSVHIIYTAMMSIALVILYLRVNVIQSPLMMTLFITTILAGLGFLLYPMARIGRNKTTLFWKIFPLFYFLLALLQIFLHNSKLVILPISIAVPIFIAISVWFSFIRKKQESQITRKDDRCWIFFFIFTLIVVITEILLKMFTGFLGEYTLNMPLIFLAWNFLTLYQYSRKEINQCSDVESFHISEDAVTKWHITEKERTIAEAVLRGCSNKEIAADLKISASTVKNHIYNIYKKTGVQSRVELVNLLR